MSDVPSIELIKQRLHVSIRPMLTELRRFLADAKGERTNFFLVLAEDDARTTAHCLLQLGLEEDANQLGRAWVNLDHWTTNVRLPELISKHAAASPDEADRLRELFGVFPTTEELLATTQERRERDAIAVSCAYRLAVKLKQLQATLSPPCEPCELSAPDPEQPEALEDREPAPTRSPLDKPAEQLTLRARVAAFMTDRAERTGKLPTLDEVFQTFASDDLGSRATFYRQNPWFKTMREGIKQTLVVDAPQKGHRNACEDGSASELDAMLKAPNFHQDELE